MGIKINLILSFVFLTVLFSFGQKTDIVERNGKKFFMHIVEQGNTLYSISREYNIHIDSIAAYNDVLDNDLKIGQVLYVPVLENSTQESESAISNTFIHIVEKKETLFGISRTYDCSVEQLTEANPNVKDGLQIGQELIIPCKSKNVPKPPVIIEEEVINQPRVFNVEDSVIRYTVQQGETLYGISKRYMLSVDEVLKANDLSTASISPGDVLIIPLKNFEGDLNEVEVRKISVEDTLSNGTIFSHLKRKNNYNVVVLAPILIDKNQKVIAGMIDQNTALNDITNLSADFIMGAKIGFDSLVNLGLNLNVSIFDTKGNVNELNTLLTKEELRNADVVIGPFFPENIEKASAWAKANQKQMIIPVLTPTKVLENNKFVTTVVPSDYTLIGGMAKHLAISESDKRVFLIKANNQKDIDKNNFFKMAFEKYATHNKLVEISGTSQSEIANQLRENDTAIFVSLTEDAKNVMSFINNINAAKNQSGRKGKSPAIVYGMKSWNDIDPLNSYYKNRFTLHTPSTNFVDYNGEPVNHFLKQYREQYKTEPGPFAMQAFDVAVGVFYEHLVLNTQPQHTVINQYHFVQNQPNFGWENDAVFIIKQEDFELKKVTKLNFSLTQNKD